MVSLSSLEQYMVTNAAKISLVELVASIFLATILAHILAKTYVKYGTSLSNREKFSDNFVTLSITKLFSHILFPLFPVKEG